MNRIFIFRSNTISFILFMFLGFTNLNSQILIESFEQPCPDFNISFSLGCIPDWIATSGSPDTRSIEQPAMPNISIPDGDRYARMYTGIETCQPNQLISESVTLNYDFKKCTNYTFSFMLKKTTFDPAAVHGQEYNAQMNIVLTDGLENRNDIANCDYIPPTINGDSYNIETLEFPQDSPWKQYQYTFSPTDDYSQLAFIPQFLDNVTEGVYFYLDYVLISAGEEQQIPDFYLTDENGGNAKDEICYPDDVWVCLGDGNFNWVNTQFTIYKEPQGSFYSKTGTVFGVDKNGCYNLSQFIRDRGNAPFKPTQTYTVKMSIQHPQCGWVDSYYTIDIVCCEEDIDASFSVKLTENFGSFDLSAEANTNYLINDGEHSFCLEVDFDNDGLVDDVLSCGSSNTFLAENLNPNYTYYLLHCVTTLCGERCDVEKILFDPSAEEECNVSRLGCLQNKDDSYLYWAQSSDIETVQIEVTINDPACGCSGPIQSRTFTAENDYIRISPALGCFSFRVKPVCIVELPFNQSIDRGIWTPRFCSPCNDLETFNDQNDVDTRSAKKIATGESILSVSPNPFQDIIHLELEETSIHGVSIELFTMTGKLILTKRLFQDEYLDLSHISYKGFLWLKVLDGENIYTKKLIKM